MQNTTAKPTPLDTVPLNKPWESFWADFFASQGLEILVAVIFAFILLLLIESGKVSYKQGLLLFIFLGGFAGAVINLIV